MGNSESRRKIRFIGLGLMGRGMATHVCDVIAFSGANSTAFQRLRPYVIEGND
jgi:3-hydroxyisobutyrate dehydrogenase-like beta-hydroxyacid dehydrogenase